MFVIPAVPWQVMYQRCTRCLSRYSGSERPGRTADLLYLVYLDMYLRVPAYTSTCEVQFEYDRAYSRATQKVRPVIAGSDVWQVDLTLAEQLMR